MIWTKVTLSDVATLNYGKSLPAKKRVPGNIPVYGSNGIVGTHDTPFVRSPGIIVGRKGSVGAVHISPKEFCPIDTTYFITPEDSKCNFDFLYFMLIHIDLPRLVSDLVPGLNRDLAYSQEVLVPPLEEQHKIATLLLTVKRAIEQQKRLIALTTELKRALMNKLFTEGTRGEKQKETEIGLVPESWDIIPLESAGEVIYGIQAAVANNTKPIGTRIITNKNITLDGELDFEKQSYFEIKTARHRKAILKKGDILFNWRSGSKEHVGKTAFFDRYGEWTHSSFILRIRASEKINNRFLFHYLSWLRAAQYFIKLHNYMVNAKFNKSAVNALPTVLPDRPEQDEIATAIDIIIEKVNHHRASNALMNRLFQMLLHQLMTAQVRVNDLDLSELENKVLKSGLDENG